MSSMELVTNSTDEKGHHNSGHNAGSSHAGNIFWFCGTNIPQSQSALHGDDHAVHEHEEGYALERFVEDIFVS